MCNVYRSIIGVEKKQLGVSRFASRVANASGYIPGTNVMFGAMMHI